MNVEVRSIIKTAEGRYLTSDESVNLLDLVKSYERRLAIMKSVEAKESIIVRQVLERAFERYPKFAGERAMSYEKGERDVTLVLRYASMAMLQGDAEWFREKVLYWFKTIVDAMVFADVARFTYATLEDVVQKTLPRADADALVPYLHIATEYLGGQAKEENR